jgi:UDP-glucose 4-epimerase
VKQCSLVYHLAEFIPETEKYGAGHVIKYSVDNPLSDFDVSCRGTILILESCRKHDKELIFTSTAAVYDSRSEKPLSEESQTVPSSPYGASKLCAEGYVKLYARLYGMRTTILRLFNVYGPRQRKYIMYDILLKLKRNSNELEILGTGNQKRDFIYVSDAVDALTIVRDNQRANGEIFNLGTGIATSIRELVELMLPILNLRPRTFYTGKSWTGDINTRIADIHRIRELGFVPKHSLESGLEKLIQWFNAATD